MSFDWQTDDDNQHPWDENETKNATSAPPSTHTPAAQHHPFSPIYKHRLFWLGLMICISFIGWRGFNWGEKQIENRENIIHTEIQTMFNLLYSVAKNRDGEGAQPIINQRDHNWSIHQTQLITTGNLLNRPAFNLTANTDTVPTLDIALATDHQSAVLHWAQPYTTHTKQTITLTQTQYATLENGRWQVAPLPGQLWGSFATAHIEQGLELSFYEIDRNLSEKLLIAIQATNLCPANSEAVGHCPQSKQNSLTQIHLSNNLETLYKIWEDEIHYYGRRATLPISLPAPTLIGLPTDRAAEQFLIEAYITQHYIASEATQATCCTLLQQALFDRHLAEKKIRPWPLQAADYAKFFHAPFKIGPHPFQQPLTNTTPAQNLWQARLAADFFYQHAADGWLNLISIQNISTSLSPPATAPQLNLNTPSHQQQWLHFIAAQAGIQLNSTIPYPDSLQLMCHPPQSENNTPQWYSYQINAGSWNRQQTLSQTTALYALPSGDGYTLTRQPLKQIAIYQTGKAPAFVNFQNQLRNSNLQEQPMYSNTQRYVTVTTSPPESSYYQIDRQHCFTADINTCTITELPSRPIWSPDDQHLLFATGPPPWPPQRELQNRSRQERVVTLADPNGRTRQYNEGTTPFWLDNQTYGFIKHGPSITETTIVTTTLDNPALIPWLTTADLSPLQPSDSQSPFQFQQITPLPTQPDTIFFAVATHEPMSPNQTDIMPHTRVGLYDLQTSSWSPIQRLLGEAQEYNWSPDGRWLLIQTTSGPNYLIDITTLQIIEQNRGTPTLTTWSSDGQWLLRNYPNFLTLTNPQTGITHPILYPDNLATCSSGGFHSPPLLNND